MSNNIALLLAGIVIGALLYYWLSPLWRKRESQPHYGFITDMETGAKQRELAMMKAKMADLLLICNPIPEKPAISLFTDLEHLPLYHVYFRGHSRSTSYEDVGIYTDVEYCMSMKRTHPKLNIQVVPAYRHPNGQYTTMDNLQVYLKIRTPEQDMELKAKIDEMREDRDHASDDL